jgi:hypothetical protein
MFTSIDYNEGYYEIHTPSLWSISQKKRKQNKTEQRFLCHIELRITLDMILSSVSRYIFFERVNSYITAAPIHNDNFKKSKFRQITVITYETDVCTIMNTKLTNSYI